MTAAVVWLGWACYAGAAIGIVIYLRRLLGRERWKRPLAAAGLLFTCFALIETPFLFEDAYDRVRLARACVVTLSLLISLGVQAYALLRPRAPEAPAAPSPTASPAEPPSQGPAA